MRKIVFDFDLTVLWPLILLFLVGLGRSIRTYISSKADCKACAEVLGMSLGAQEREEILERKRTSQQQNWVSKDLIRASAIALGACSGAVFMPDNWKILAAYFSWYFLSFASAALFIFAIVLAWDYAKKSDVVKFLICILVMLIAAASAEHFYHQKINADYVTFEAQ